MSLLNITYDEGSVVELVSAGDGEFISSNIQINENDRTLHSSITMTVIHRKGDTSLRLKNSVLNSLISKVEWVNDDGMILDTLEGTIVSQWTLNENPAFQETLSFQLID